MTHEKGEARARPLSPSRGLQTTGRAIAPPPAAGDAGNRSSYAFGLDGFETRRTNPAVEVVPVNKEIRGGRRERKGILFLIDRDFKK